MYPVYFRDIIFGKMNSQQDLLRKSSAVSFSYSTSTSPAPSMSMSYYNQVLSNSLPMVPQYNTTTLHNNRGKNESSMKRIYQSVEICCGAFIFRQYRIHRYQLLFQLLKRKQGICIDEYSIISNRYKNNPISILKASLEEGKKVIQFKPYNSESAKVMEEFGLKPFFEVGR